MPKTPPPPPPGYEVAAPAPEPDLSEMAEKMLKEIIEGYNEGYCAAVAAGDFPSTAVTAQVIVNVITESFEDPDLRQFAMALVLAKAIEKLPIDGHSADQNLQ